MSLTHEREFDAASNLYQVIATLDSQLLPQAREALTSDRVLSVMVSSAVTWNEQGREMAYRNSRFRADREVARLEITCAEPQVEWVLRAVDRVLQGAGTREHAQGSVVAFAIDARTPHASP